MRNEESIHSSWKNTIKILKQNSSLGFCLSHLEILITVYLNDGITRQDLMSCIKNVSPTTLKRYVKDMVSEYEYISETCSVHDTRIKQLHITGKGKLLIKIILDNKYI